MDVAMIMAVLFGGACVWLLQWATAWAQVAWGAMSPDELPYAPVGFEVRPFDPADPAAHVNPGEHIVAAFTYEGKLRVIVSIPAVTWHPASDRD